MIRGLLIYSIYLCLCLSGLHAQQQNPDLFVTDETEIPDNNFLEPIELDELMIRKQLESKSGMVVLPYLNSEKRFKVESFSIYGDEKNPYPDIKTFRIYSMDDKELKGRITMGPAGLNIIYLKSGKMVRIYNPEFGKSTNRNYVQEMGISPEAMALHSCSVHEGFDISDPGPGEADPDVSLAEPILKRNGSTKRVYRAAIMCTGEYYNANGGGATAIRQLMIANLNDISAIFENEVAVEMYMAIGSPRIQDDIDNDPFDPNFGGRTQQAQNAIENAFPIGRYDVGHVFHNHTSGDGWETGGVAGLGVVCNDDRKASGWSGSFNNTSNGWIQLAAHEFGHMYNATHTFNGSGDANCTPNIAAVSNYEIGSGTTIMSYNGLCDAEQNIPGGGVADNYFHANSLERMVDFLENGATCNQTDWIVDNNTVPVADANPCGAVYIMPRLTPFMLKGAGSDLDGDFLTYCWEQYDEDGPSSTATIGLIGSDAASNAECPLYRSFPPTPSPIRYIPNLTDLANNANSDFEVLTRRMRNITFRLTVRDNNPAGGAIDWEDITINTRNQGPLSVLTPGPGEIIQAGTAVTINWNTNGSEAFCEKSIIRLSTDGGLSFPLVIADDIDYAAGTALVNIPASFPNTEEARVMVACDDYECFAFFDINNSNFTIESNCFAPSNQLCDTQEEVYDFGDPGLNLDLQAMQGEKITSLLGPMPDFSSLETMSPAVNNATGTCTRISTIDNPFLEVPFYVTASGTYVFNINNNLNDIVTAYTIFDADGFDPNDACSSFVESNATFINSYTYNTSFNVELESCKEYILVAQVTSGSSENLAISSISGPGDVLRADNAEDYSTTFVAVDRNTELIIFHSPDSDFRSLPVGEYSIVSAYYKDGGPTPPEDANPDSWIGLTVDELLSGLDCFRTSINEKLLTVNQSCFVYDIVAENQTACNPESNTYEQTISFKVDMGPGSGTVTINGQSFTLDGDEATVTLTDLIATGRPVDLEFEFSDDIGCNGIFEDVFIAAANCCPIDVDLGEDMMVCEGEVIRLDAGSEATSYTWFRDGEELSETGQFLDVNETGTYLVQVSHTSGCINEDEVSISFEALPVITLDRNEILACEGDLVVLNAEISVNDADIQWSRNGEILPNTGSSLEISESGLFELRVTTQTGCSNSVSIVSDFADSPEVDLGPDILTCNGAITILDAGPEGDAFAWRRNAFPIPGDESTIEVNNFGTYSVIVTNANGCIGLDTIDVDYEPLPEFDFGRDVTRCFGNFYTIEAEPSVFEIQWYLNGELIDGAEEINYRAVESGEYVGEIFVNDQCIENDTIQITYLDAPDVDFPEIISACPGEIVDLVIDDLNAVYTWSSEADGVLPETGNTLSVSTSGIYYIEARSVTTFCITRDTVEVQFTDIPELDLGMDLTGCENESITIQSPANGFPVEWYKDGELIDNVTGESLIVSESGEYVMRIDSGQDCVTSDTISVSFFPAPLVELGDDLSACPGEILTLDGGDSNNTYEWSQDGTVLAETGSLLEVSTSGTYIVQSTNPGGCSSRDTISINFADLPVLDFSDDITRCDDDVYTIETGAVGFSVDWYFNGELISNVNDADLNADASGQYVAVVSGGANCTVSDTTQVRYVAYPEVELGPDLSACPGEEIIFTIEDMGYTYQWSGENQGSLSNTSNALNISVTDTYYVTVINDAGCTTRDTVSVSFVDLPVLDLGSDTELCAGDALRLQNESNGFSVEWLRDGEVLNSETNNFLDITESGEYIMRISASQDCQVSDTVEVMFFDLPVVDLGNDRSACPGETVSLNGGSTDNDYIWRSETQGTLSETSNILEVTETDTYSVRVSNSAGCESFDTVSISFTELPVIELGEDIDTLCQGEEITLSINAMGFDVQWFRDGDVLAGELDETLTVTESGTFSVQVSASGNCSVTEEIAIRFNSLPQINSLADAVACTGESVSLSAGQDGAFRYIWSDQNGVIKDGDEGTLVVNNSDTYTVEAIDMNNCRSIEMAEIDFIDAPTVELDELLEFCEGSRDTIVAVSNVSVIEWYADNTLIAGETGLELEIETGGEYIAVVGPGTQCEARDTITVNEISAPEIEILSDNQICADAIPYDLEIQTDPGNSIQWFQFGQALPGETGTSLSVSQGGSFLVEVQSPESCRSSAEISIQVIELPEIELPVVPQLCEGDAYIINAMSNGDRFEWTRNGSVINGETNLELEIFDSGEYSFISYNELDCAVSQDFTVNFDPLPDADLGMSQISACNGESVTLSVPDNSNNDYIWTKDGQVLTGETGSSIEVSEEGSYSIEVTNSFGCAASDQTEVMFFQAPQLEIDNSFSYCANNSVELTLETNASLITWEFNGNVLARNTNSLEVSSAGTYLVSVESADGCVVTETIQVTENANPQISLDDISLCPGETQTVTVSQGFQDYAWGGYASFLDNDASSFVIDYDGFEQLFSEEMTLTVTDDNGCQADASATVTLFPLLQTEVFAERINICKGESVMLEVQGGLYYEWTNPNNSLSATNTGNPVATPESTTTYTVSITDDCPNNFDSYDIEVIVNEPPQIDAGRDTCTIAGAELRLMATGGVQYTWNNTEFIIGSSTRADIIVSVPTDTVFTVTGIDENGCQATDDVRVCVLEDPFDILTAVTLITPNGDARNDVLEFRGLEAFPENTLTVFNRWGNVIYKKSGYQNDALRWDGTRDGEPLPADTYYYILEFSNFTIKKSITLLRD